MGFIQTFFNCSIIRKAVSTLTAFYFNYSNILVLILDPTKYDLSALHFLQRTHPTNYNPTYPFLALYVTLQIQILCHNNHLQKAMPSSFLNLNYHYMLRHHDIRICKCTNAISIFIVHMITTRFLIWYYIILGSRKFRIQLLR